MSRNCSPRRRERSRRSAPFGAYFDAGDVQVISNSPECFLDVDLGPERRVSTWPLKGTRAAGGDPNELADSIKDRAEHVMIVDLERNDLGRVAVPGTVVVSELMRVVRHPTVIHLESRIDAEPREGVTLTDILRATFPGGSITGAPKIRAMEIISELERSPRGIYCGAFGCIAWGGRRSRWSIPIRTAVLQGQRLSVRLGGGVVADSDARAEYEETLIKGQAFLELL